MYEIKFSAKCEEKLTEEELKMFLNVFHDILKLVHECYFTNEQNREFIFQYFHKKHFTVSNLKNCSHF